LTQRLGLERPFDEGFRDAMIATAEAVLVDSGGRFAYTESDEISVLLPRDSDWFGRRVEKLVSTFAATASAALTLRLGCCATFDARLIPLPTEDDILAYFCDRQDDANRNAINGLTYYHLLGHGASVTEATATLHSQGFSFKNEYLFRHGINYNDVESWKKRGVLLRFEEYEKQGYNPLAQRTETALRRRLVVDLELPVFRREPEYLRGVIRDA
jgi:tRNA(His) 5'-end guanylyltransferase